MEGFDTESSSDDELLPGPSFDTPSVQTDQRKEPTFKDLGDFSSSINAPEDRFNIIYIIFVIQGIGMLLPWNFFITAKSYFEFKFKGDKPVAEKFENAFALGAMFPMFGSTFLNIFLVKLSRTKKVIINLIVMFSLFVVTTVFAKINTESYPEIFFTITVSCVVLINFAGGMYQGTIFGIAGIVGVRYTQAIMSGQSVAGIFAAIADLVTKLATPEGEDPSFSGFMYFLTATIVIAITAISYMVLVKMPRMQFYFRRFKRHTKKDNARKEKVQSKSDTPYFLILKEIKWAAFSVSVVFFVTLALFPAVISKIESVDKKNGSRFTNDLFPSLVCFLTFNVGDWCGRQLAGQFQCLPERGPVVPVLSVLRVVFIPLFLMCNIPGNDYLPHVFMHDVWPVIFNVLFAVSNGYLGSICMMTGPKLVRLEYAETAGTMMGLFLNTGLIFGALASFGF